MPGYGDCAFLDVRFGVCGLPPSALPGISLTRVEIESWRGPANLDV